MPISLSFSGSSRSVGLGFFNVLGARGCPFAAADLDSLFDSKRLTRFRTCGRPESVGVDFAEFRLDAFDDAGPDTDRQFGRGFACVGDVAMSVV